MEKCKYGTTKEECRLIDYSLSFDLDIDHIFNYFMPKGDC